MRRRILITGSQGFLGSSLFDYLKKVCVDSEIWGLGRSICRIPSQMNTYVQCDLTSAPQTKTALDIIKPNIVIHTAANATPSLGTTNPDLMLRDNTAPILNIVNNYKAWIINLSSIVIYGDCPLFRPNESIRPDPTSLYAVTKVTSEQILEVYRKDRTQLITNLRLCSVIGSGATHGAVLDLAKKLKSGTVNAFGNEPGSCKSYLNINDFVRAVKFVLDKVLLGNYNVCPDDAITIKEVIETLAKSMNIDKYDLTWSGSSYSGDNPKLWAQNNLLKSKGFEYLYLDSKQAVEQVGKSL